jgi:hypothetical protein
MGYDHIGNTAARVELPRQLDERGLNSYIFRDAMLKLLLAETLPYAKLIE